MGSYEQRKSGFKETAESKSKVRAQLPVPEPEDPCNHPPVNNAVEEQETRCARPLRRTAIAADCFRAELYK